MATCYELDGPGIEFRWKARFSVFVQTGRGDNPTSLTLGAGSFTLLKRPWSGVDRRITSIINQQLHLHKFHIKPVKNN